MRRGQCLFWCDMNKYARHGNIFVSEMEKRQSLCYWLQILSVVGVKIMIKDERFVHLDEL